MFSSSKVSQAMIDAVKSVLGQTKPEPVQEVKTPEQGGRVPFAPATPTTLTESSPIKEPTPTGMRVYGSSYGNSAKAKKDQTKSPVDALKGPKDKEMKEELKSETFEFHLTEGSYADLHKKWGDTHNIEYHSHTLYPKHTVTKFDNEKDAESHAKKTGGTVRMNVSPKMKNEELKGNQAKIDANHNNKIDGQDFKILQAKKKVKEEMSFANKLLETVRKSDVPAYLRKAKGDTPLTVADAKGPKKDSISAPENLAKNRNEEVEKYEPSNAPLTTDTLAGRMPGGKSNSFKSFKTRVKPVSKEGETKPGDDTPELIQPQDTPARRSHEVKEETIEEVTIAGTPGWKEMPKDVKDKSGAVHTPMSRAKDLARSAFKKIQKEVK